MRLSADRRLVAAGWGFEAQHKADSPHPNLSALGEGLVSEANYAKFRES